MSTMQREPTTAPRPAAPAGTFRGAFPRPSAGSTRRRPGRRSTGWCDGSRIAIARTWQKRPSKHVYVRTLPGPVIEQVDRLRDSPLIRSLIARQVPAGSVIAPMKHTDELYISHYNKDRGGDQGLFDKHYDGNLRFLSSSVVVRALIYLQSDATYKVVFARQPGREGVRHLRVRPAGLSPRAALGRRAIQPGRSPAHPAQVQLPGHAAATPLCSGGPRSPPTPPCSTS